MLLITYFYELWGGEMTGLRRVWWMHLSCSHDARCYKYNNSPGATPHTNMSAECASHSAAHTREIQRSAYHSIIRAPLDPFCYPEYGLAPILNKHNMIFFLIVLGMQVSLNLAIIKENMLHRLCALFEVWGSDLELESSDSVNNCGVLISQTCVGSG